MNLDDAKKRIQTYLKSQKAWPLIVDVQTRQDRNELINFFEIGENKFPDIESFCNKDGDIKLDELFAALSSNEGNTFITCLSGFLKLMGEAYAKAALKTIVTTSVSGHIVVITYQCRNYLRFSDPRIAETGRVAVVDGDPDGAPDICFIDPALADAFPECYRGLQMIGAVAETCDRATAYIATTARKEAFPESVYPVSQLSNGYDILKDKDPRTTIVPQSFGTAEQWNYVLQKMGKDGSWSSVIEEEFGSEGKLSQAIASYSKFDAMKRWLYYTALSICGAKDNEYLRMVLSASSNADNFIRTVFRCILAVDKSNPKFSALYDQRKTILKDFRDRLAEVTDYCNYLATKGEDAIYYLTDLTIPEKERVIAWLSSYGERYDTAQLIEILSTVYPDLAKYLSKYRYKNSLLDSYFEAYKYQKVINRILPSFEQTVDTQSKCMDFVSVLKPRSYVVDRLDTAGAKAYFFDALGVEYLGFIQEKCNEYGLSANITCARCDLPSITCYNKEFVETLRSKGCSVSDIKDLDEIKHHGEDSFDYEKEKTPIYLIRELEIIDELLKKIQAGIFNNTYAKIIILSDHGASRLAVLHETENIWSMATSGEHSGRCCPVSDLNAKPESAIEENGFWVLANYDRFKGSRRANVEVHGGASLEEVAVPIIEITRKRTNVEALITDSSKVITLSAKEHAIIDIYVAVKSNDIGIRLDGNYFEAAPTSENYIYRVDLPAYTKKGVYSFDILNGNDVLASGQQFEIKKKGMAENIDLFDFG